MLKKWLIAIFVALITYSTAICAQRPADFHDRYTLQQVVVLSRHHIRSPLSTDGSALARITPHAWFNWTSGPSELSLRGGELETLLGQYFRKWLVSEGLITENYIPRSGEMLFYANSMQRTIATTQYFSSGMLPVANVRIKHRYAPSRMDPMFEPRLTFVSEKYRQLALKQITEMGGPDGIKAINQSLAKRYALLEKVLDFQKSDIAKTDNLKHFGDTDFEIMLDVYKEPNMRGSLKLANQASDALILQYYEQSDPVKAAFGHRLTKKQWEQLASIKDTYGDVLFTAPAIAVNVANPLLTLMSKELKRKNRKFTFLCGHDSNLTSVLISLRAKPYELPYSIEKQTPAGSKLVVTKWLGKDGQQYAAIDLVYQTVDQLRNRSMLSLDTPPQVFPIALQDLQANADGVYKLADVQQRFQEAIDEFKALKKQLK